MPSRGCIPTTNGPGSCGCFSRRPRFLPCSWEDRPGSVGRHGWAGGTRRQTTRFFRSQCSGSPTLTTSRHAMGDISRVALFGKLNSLAYKSIESATVFCKLRGNPYVELVHWMHQILQQPNSDLACIVRAFNLDSARLAQNITEALDRLPRGATAISDLSAHIEDATERAWVWSTLKFGASQIRTGYVLLALLKQPSLKNV